MKNTVISIALAAIASISFTSAAHAEFYSGHMYDEMSDYVNHTDRNGNVLAEVWADVSTDKTVRAGRYYGRHGFITGNHFESDKLNTATVTEIVYFH